MSTHREEKCLDSKLNPKKDQQSSSVKFDLGASQLNDDYDQSVDNEADDQFEFSTLSKPSSTSSMDSTTNITNSNGSV
ncbi:unnamed protein product, partial [Rotaria magnacalcarata]